MLYKKYFVLSKKESKNEGNKEKEKYTIFCTFIYCQSTVSYVPHLFIYATCNYINVLSLCVVSFSELVCWLFEFGCFSPDACCG